MRVSLFFRKIFFVICVQPNDAGFYQPGHGRRIYFLSGCLNLFRDSKKVIFLENYFLFRQ